MNSIFPFYFFTTITQNTSPILPDLPILSNNSRIKYPRNPQAKTTQNKHCIRCYASQRNTAPTTDSTSASWSEAGGVGASGIIPTSRALALLFFHSNTRTKYPAAEKTSTLLKSALTICSVCRRLLRRLSRHSFQQQRSH